MSSPLLGKLMGLMTTMSAIASGRAVRYRTLGGQPDTAINRSSPRRVLFIHRDLLFHGGVPRCLLYLARATDAQRVDFHLACFKDPSEGMTEAFGELGIKPDCLGDQGHFRPARRLAAIVEKKEIDVIVATSFKAYLCAKLAAWRTRVCVVFWLHAIRGAVEGPIRRNLLKYLARRDPILFVSNAVREAQLPAGHRGLADVVHNGVEDIETHPQYQPYSPERRKDFGLADAKLVLGYTAEFVNWKDHATLIEAMHLLARDGFDVDLLLIGAGELMEEKRRQAAAGPAARHIHFLGTRPDARRLLGLVDIYVHPSRKEGFGLAVVEAMLAARPIIAARDGALIEYVIQDQTGMLFQTGDARDLAQNIMKLAADPARASRMGASAREYCLKAFNMDHFADSICGFIERACPCDQARISKERESASFPLNGGPTP